MSVSLINTLAQPLKSAAQFVAHQERASGLSTSRFIQDTSTCLAPKAVFSRSKADLAENAFLELTQGAVIYFLPALLGEKVARKYFSKNLDEKAKELIAKPAVELLNQKNVLNKKLLPVKAAIALSATVIPLAAFAISYMKNLFTLKVFKTGDFNNIANLENVKEDKTVHDRVRKGAYRGLFTAAAAYAACLGTAFAVAKRGANSKFLQGISELVLAPGSKLFKNNEKKKNFFNKYFSLDFASEKGKLALSKGQLTACVLIGGLGYFGASADRGKQNFLETLFRLPVIGFYVITGSELFEQGFKKILKKMGKCKELIGENLHVPTMDEIPAIARKNIENLSKTKTIENIEKATEAEFKKLAKQKVLISGVPYLFGIGVMGFFVAGISNLFTRYRHKKETQKNTVNNVFIPCSESTKKIFKDFPNLR